MTRDYYNRRTGQTVERPRLTLLEAASQIASAYRFVHQRGYLQRSFGYRCVDAGEIAGCEGNDLRAALHLATAIAISSQVDEWIAEADECGVFTLIEFVFDHVAKPHERNTWHHAWDNCGLHCTSLDDPSLFDEATARAEWRAKVNSVLKFYENGFELSQAGEIVRLAPDGVSELVRTSLPTATKHADVEKVAHAIRTFHLGRSTREERKQAVRALFDVLEFHRPAVKSLLKKDEDGLFNIANNFSIRHHRDNQKDDYDDAWLTWMFYVNLATVHLVLGRVHGVNAFEPDLSGTSASGGRKLVL